MQPRVFPAMYWFITIIAMIFLCGSTLVFANDDEKYVNCGNLFDCGDIKGVGYPFSGSNTPDYCGYPGFKLDCSDQDPEITIKNLTYKVLDINNQSRILGVARKDYPENNICPTLLLNTTWIPNILNYTPDDQDITIYYGCPAQGAPTLASSAQFTCNINDTDMTGYFVTVNNSVLSRTVPSLITYLTTCNNSVKVPVRQSALVSLLQNPNATQLLGAINQGFDLVWSANDSLCDTCQLSGGKCGYNQTTTAFSCYCKDQPREFSCQQSPPGAQSPSMSSCLL